MSKIDVKQIGENEIQVILTPDTSVELANKLTESMSLRGMVEDLSKSTISNRFFHRQSSDVMNTADRLIKSLECIECLAKAKLPWWATTQQDVDDWKEKNRLYDIERQTKSKISKPNLANIKPDTSQNTEDFTIAPSKPSGISVLPPNTNKLHNPQKSGTVDYNKRSYGTTDDGDVNKSDYGPKGGGQYDAADNAKRKAKNTGEVSHSGPNMNVKAYSSKPAQLTANQLAEIESKKYGKMSAKQPVKVFNEKEKNALAVKMGLKKSWVNHNPIPNAEIELAKIKSKQCQQGDTEQKTADQLRNLLLGKSMLGVQPPPQPTDTEMFGHLVVSEDMAKSAEKKWSNTFNNWLSEAQKPINARFSSPEEERKYWDSISINDSTDECPGS